ncbi:MAG: cupin domain-containing protein [Myxococcota bacterium]
MNDLTFKMLEDISAYEGPHAIPGVRFKSAGQALGISAWGMNVIELDPNCEGYPEHDHKSDGQEEVYVVLRGSVIVQTQSGEQELLQGGLVRVPAEVRRKLVTRERGATILALGGTPGEPYKPSMGG